MASTRASSWSLGAFIDIFAAAGLKNPDISILSDQFLADVRTGARGQLMEREALARLLARTARVLVDNSIWTVTRAVNSRVTKFVGSCSAVDGNRRSVDRSRLS